MYRESTLKEQDEIKRQDKKRFLDDSAQTIFGKAGVVIFLYDNKRDEDIQQTVSKSLWGDVLRNGDLSSSGLLMAYDLSQESSAYVLQFNKNRSLTNLYEAMKDYFSDTPETWQYLRESHKKREAVYNPLSTDFQVNEVLGQYGLRKSSRLGMTMADLYYEMSKELEATNRAEKTRKANDGVASKPASKEVRQKTWQEWMRLFLDEGSRCGKGGGYLDLFPYEDMEGDVLAMGQFDRAIRFVMKLDSLKLNNDGLYGMNEHVDLVNRLSAYQSGSFLTGLGVLASDFTGDTVLWKDLYSPKFHQLVCGALERIMGEEGKPFTDGEMVPGSLESWRRNPGVVFGMPAFTQEKIDKIARSHLWRSPYRKIALQEKDVMLKSGSSDKMVRANLAKDFFEERRNNLIGNNRANKQEER